jgi:hypothetical protein
VLLGTVGGATSSFTDDGTLTPGAESPLPIGSTGAWKVLPSMGSNRVGAASVVGADPATPGTFYVYALLGLNQAAIPLTSYEYLPINVALNGRQTVGTWTTGVATSAAGRWQLGAWSVDAATAPTVSGTDVWVFLGGGVSATNTAVNKVEAGKIAAGGDLGTLSDTPTDFSTTHAGYGVLAGNGRLFTFGGANALPSTGATVATLSSPPTLAGVAWNNDGLLLAQARYLMGNATRGCFEFLIGGQTFAPADASTEVVVW